MELGQFTLSSMTPIPVVNPNHLSITLKYEKLLNPIAKKMSGAAGNFLLIKMSTGKQLLSICGLNFELKVKITQAIGS